MTIELGVSALPIDAVINLDNRGGGGDDENAEETEDDASMTSADQALCEMLGISSLRNAMSIISDDDDDDDPEENVHQPECDAKTDQATIAIHNVDDHESPATNGHSAPSDPLPRRIVMTSSSSSSPTSSLDDLLCLAMDTTRLLGMLQRHDLLAQYARTGICQFPHRQHTADRAPFLCIPEALMQRLTNEIVFSKPAPSDGHNDDIIDTDAWRMIERTYETIRKIRKKRKIPMEDATDHDATPNDHERKEACHSGHLQERDDTVLEEVQERVLTRLENFVNVHTGWSTLCHDIIARWISALVGEPMCLFKEKLNIKPAGGSGYAPHVDGPSLRVPFGATGPQEFVTVMITIDPATTSNGCLRVVRPPPDAGHAWAATPAVPTMSPEVQGNPDAGGRAGAICPEVADTFEYEDMIGPGGMVLAFNGWVPHRSAANRSPFARRAVFLTYNPVREGNFHLRYYQRMKELRHHYRSTNPAFVQMPTGLT